MKKLFVVLSLFIMSASSFAGLYTKCDSKCEVEVLSLKSNIEMLDAFLGSVRGQAIETVTGIALQSDYVESNLVALELLMEPIKSLVVGIRINTMRSVRNIAINNSDNEIINQKALEALSFPVKSKFGNIRGLAIELIEEIALASSSLEVKKEAIELLALPQSSMVRDIRLKANDSVLKISQSL